MLKVEENQISAIGRVLNDQNRPLKERFRALFTLKNIGGSKAIEQIYNCFKDESALLKHELAYCLGQMQDSHAVPILIEILKDTTQEPMVRHEAGEALGAIGDSSVIPILKEYSKDCISEVAETLDPAPPADITDVKKLKEILLDENVPLFERYQAMFSLRNIHTPESILALGEGLKVGSALFKHEIAFVLGQLQEEIAVPHLEASLKDTEENEMVRHECAEALGSIATPDCYDILNKYINDNKRVVRESCVIALDMCEYENSSEFQYADTLGKVAA
ncbi:Deoxyhypusine hydroxylase [Anthophora quadrimaculata]